VSEPDYYASNGLSPLKAYEQGLLSKEEYIGFLKGNVIKYTVRAGKKDADPLMDIFKAIDYLHYLHKALKSESQSDNTNDDDSGDYYNVEDLDSKLADVQNKIDDFKRNIGIQSETDNTDDCFIPLSEEESTELMTTCENFTPKTHLRPKMIRKFPKYDDGLRHVEPLVHKPGVNWLSKLRDKTIGVW